MVLRYSDGDSVRCPGHPSCVCFKTLDNVLSTLVASPMSLALIGNSSTNEHKNTGSDSGTQSGHGICINIFTRLLVLNFIRVSWAHHAS